MIFRWLRDRKRKKILKTPFPVEWREILADKVVHYSYLNREEQFRLEQLVQFFIAEKNFEGCGGLELSDEIRVVVAGQASLLVLGLPAYQYKELQSVLIYPTTVTIPTGRQSIFADNLGIVPNSQAILGLASMRGPVVLVWDAVLRGARHPEQGHNVVYHEFAHILDMRDGAVDGTPELHSVQLYRQWVEVCTKEYFKLKKLAKKGKKCLLDHYGAIHEAEFFAVATELFFDRPLRMRKELPELYDVLRAYYHQDTAERELRYRSDQEKP